MKTPSARRPRRRRRAARTPLRAYQSSTKPPFSIHQGSGTSDQPYSLVKVMPGGNSNKGPLNPNSDYSRPWDPTQTMGPLVWTLLVILIESPKKPTPPLGIQNQRYHPPALHVKPTLNRPETNLKATLHQL